MSVCPSQDLLQGLLDERLEGAQLAEIVIHVEICPQCQELLETLTRRHGWKKTVPETSGEPDRGEWTAVESYVSLDGEPEGGSILVAKFSDAIDEPDHAGDSTNPATTDDFAANPDRAVVPTGPSASESSSPRTDWPRVPGYEIMERLGEGGMGVVYEARQVGLNRRVALKMIRGGAQARPDHVARFRIEAEAVARLRHANIIQIYDIGEVDGLPFFSVELLAGGSLADRLQGTPQPGWSSAELLATLALAIEAAHQAGIVHRDLKPTNVLFNEEGTPKISDFGLAKRIDSDDHQTQTGQVMGSPSYMAPEQARGHTKDVGKPTDVYALGAILYEMLTGRPPFKGETPVETIRQVIDDDPVPPSRLVPRLPRDLETICLKCLHKEPLRRYASALALVDDLERYRNGKPIKARPIPFWERGAKWARRHPLWAAASILVGLLSTGLIAGVVVDGQTVLAHQTAGLSLLEKADAARSPGELEQIQLKLTAFMPVIDNEPRLRFLADRIALRQKRISKQLDAFRSEQAKRDQFRAARDQLQQFRALRNEAQLYAARLIVVDPAEHQKALRAVVLAALTVYGQKPQAPATAWSFAQPLTGGLDPTEHDEVKGGCYDLLLILSEAEDPAAGLRILDRAARLHPAPTFGYHLLRAASLHRTNDDAGQAREEQLARNLTPVSAFDHLLIAREQFARAQRAGSGQLVPGEARDAIHSAQAAIRLDPNQLGARLLLAVVYFKTQRFSEAKTNLDTCIHTAPNLLDLYLFRALVSGEEGAKALLKIKEDPARAAVWQLEAAEAFAAAEGDYRRALDLRPGPGPRYVLLVNRGGMYFQAGRLDQATADLEAAVELNPTLFHAHAVLAQALERQGRFELAALALDRAIERQPERPELYRARALLGVRSQRKEGSKPADRTPVQRALAIRDLERAIRLEPDDSPQTADDHAERGRLLFASGQTREALAAYDAALRIVPNDLKALRLRALALLEREQYDDVLAACTAFLEQGKPSADLLEIRGQARLARKEFDGAISDYTVALSLTPNSPGLHNHRGWAYLFADAFKLALADFDAAVRLDPGLGHAYSGRGLARVSLGRWRDAVADAETAVRLATGAEKQRAYFNAARVNALALKFAAQQVSRQGEAGLALHRRLRERTAALLLQSVHQLPADRQASFWRDVVASDPVLRPFIP